MHTKQGYKQTEIGQIPEEWKIIEFSKIVESTQLGTTKRGTNSENILLIKMGNIINGGFDFSKIEYVSEDIIDNLNSILHKKVAQKRKFSGSCGNRN